MFRLFKHYIPYPVLFLAALDFVLLVAAAEWAWVLRAHQIGMALTPISGRVLVLIDFAFALQLALLAVGGYGPDAFQSLRYATTRLMVAFALGSILLMVLDFLVPGMTLWRSNLLYALVFGYALLVGIRALLGGAIGGATFKRRVLVLGAGQRANRLRKLAEQKHGSFVLIAHIDMGDVPSVIPEAIPRACIPNLADYVAEVGANEVVLALQERRNAIPLDDLLRVRTRGAHVNEISTFLERETGRVDLRSVNPSWLIFSDGFSSGRRLSSAVKRLADIFASAALMVLTAPLVALFALLVKCESAGPAFYRQVRVGLYGTPFTILKLRSMRVDAEVPGQAQWAAENDPRVTRIGRFIRLTRIDELPQLWMVLRGDMSFVGPRPERPSFVSDLEQQIPYYAERHMVKPGVTGWAQINYPYGATVQDARVKLEYDLYYAKNYTPLLDILILIQTVRVILFPSGAR